MFSQDPEQAPHIIQNWCFCDCCGRDLDPRQWSEEFQEALHIRYRPGHGSDHIPQGCLVECVICQHCVHKFLGKYMRITRPDVVHVPRPDFQLDDEYVDYMRELRDYFGGEGDDETKH